MPPAEVPGNATLPWGFATGTSDKPASCCSMRTPTEMVGAEGRGLRPALRDPPTPGRLHRFPKLRLPVASPDRPALQPTPSTPPEGQRGEPVLQTHTVRHPSHLRACAHSMAFVSDVLFPFLTWPPPMPGHGLVKSFSTPASQPVGHPHTVLAQAAYLPSTPHLHTPGTRAPRAQPGPGPRRGGTVLSREPGLGAGRLWANGRTSLSLAFLIFQMRIFHHI